VQLRIGHPPANWARLPARDPRRSLSDGASARVIMSETAASRRNLIPPN
jgi:hypothetical protein